jgi:hypothetical protein
VTKAIALLLGLFKQLRGDLALVAASMKEPLLALYRILALPFGLVGLTGKGGQR